MSANQMNRRWIDIDAIHIGERLREPDMARVAEISKSIAEIGLLNPPAVRFVEKMTIDGVEEYNVPVMIVGHHRILALQQLGKESVECDVYDVDPLQAELMEIAENLHRAELTALERDEQIARWIELVATKKEENVSRQPDAKPKAVKTGRPEGGVRAAARGLNISEADARRSVKVASLSPAAKAVAREAGLSSNRSALLEAAKESEPEKQVAVLKGIHAARQAKAGRGAADKAQCIRDRETGQENSRSILLMNIAAAIQAATYQGPTDDDLVALCGRVASAWLDLADDLRERLADDTQSAPAEAEALTIAV